MATRIICCGKGVEPRQGSGTIVFIDPEIDAKLVMCFIANTSSLVFDYAANGSSAGRL